MGWYGADPGVLARLAAMESNAASYPSPVSLAAVLSSIPTPADVAPPAAAAMGTKGTLPAVFAQGDHTHAERTKWAGTAQTTNSSGVWTKTLPANLLINSPAVSITPRMPSGFYAYRIAIAGTSAAGFAVTVTFTKIKESLSVTVLGTYPTVEVGTAIGVVTFDISFFEPDQIGN